MAVQQPAHPQPMGGQFPGHLGQQQRPLHHPIRQVVAHIGEAQPGHAGGGALLGVPSPLRCQPLWEGRQPHPRTAAVPPGPASPPRGSDWSSRSARAGGSASLDGSPHFGLKRPRQLWPASRWSASAATRMMTRPPRISFGSKGERDPPGAGMATPRLEGLDQAPRVRGDQTGPTCGLPAARPAIGPCRAIRQVRSGLEELLPFAWHRTDRYANNRVEADHGRLKAWLRPMRGLKQDRSARVVLVGHAFIQNLRRGHYELAAEEPITRRLPVAFDELALAI